MIGDDSHSETTALPRDTSFRAFEISQPPTSRSSASIGRSITSRAG
jgi:hypothetical protein